MAKKRTYARKKKREVLADYQAGDEVEALYKGAIIPVVVFSSLADGVFCRLVDRLGAHVILPPDTVVAKETSLRGESIVYDSGDTDPLGGK